MAGKSRLFPGQKCCEMNITISEEMRTQLREVARTYGLEPAAYVRSLVAAHLMKLKASEREGVS